MAARPAGGGFAAALALSFTTLVAPALPCSAPVEPDGPDDPAFFETKIRPLLHDHCVKCHGPPRPKSGLRLDTPAGIRAGGSRGALLVAGKPEESLLVAALSYAHEELKMPPRGRLGEELQADVAEWVRRGAPMPAEDAPPAADEASERARAGFDLAARKEQHWAWQPIRPCAPPPVAQSSWPLQPNDAFILARLEEEGLSPAADASKATWLRRVTFDLIGLPPTLDDQESFLADDSATAFAAVVDRLLASPHFGERWARHWLDLVRYAEGRGHEFDWSIPNAFAYRDYLIRALNADVPYPQLLQEHVAGDLLDPPRVDPASGANESILATGFWYLGEEVHSPVDVRQDECDRVANQLDVFSKAFLGVTVACARCHDHKFDAISQRDYYGLAGFLASTTCRQVPYAAIETNRRVAQEVVELRAARRRELERELAADLEPAVAQAARCLAGDAAALDAFVHAGAPSLPVLDAGVVIVDFARSQPGDFTLDGVAFGIGPLAAGEPRFDHDATLRVDHDATLRGFAEIGCLARDFALDRVRPAADREIESSRLKFEEPGRLLRTRSFTLQSGRLHYLVRGKGHLFACIDAHRMVEGPLHNMTLIEFDTEGRWRWVTHLLDDYVGQRVHVELGPDPLDAQDCAPDLALAAIVDAKEAPVLPHRVHPLVAAHLAEGVKGAEGADVADGVANDPAVTAAAVQAALLEALARLSSEGLAGAADGGDVAALLNAVLARPDLFPRSDRGTAAIRFSAEQSSVLARLKQGSPVAPAMFEGSGFDEWVLARGNPKNPGERAPRRFLEAIDGPAPLVPAERESGSGRLALAQRLVAPDNPLVARVAVNRVWHHLFGRGIVKTVDDFGVLGERPSHPELLDHLAWCFLHEGGSLKGLIRELVLSRTYRMGSAGDPRADQLDPENRLLHRMPVRRLEAEPIRDALLAVSGRLDDTLFGPSVPTFLTPFMEGRGRPQSGPLDGSGRRTIYLSVKRNFLSPFLLAFDFPVPATTCGRRSISNVPAQALALMNGELVQQEARRWAKRELDAGPATPAERIERMYREAFTRPPCEEELAATQRWLIAQATARGTGLDDLDLWSDLAHVLFCTKEFLFVE